MTATAASRCRAKTPEEAARGRTIPSPAPCAGEALSAYCGGTSELRHELGALVIIRAVMELDTPDAEAAVDLVLGQVGPGGLGVELDDPIEQAQGLGVLLRGLLLG